MVIVDLSFFILLYCYSSKDCAGRIQCPRNPRVATPQRRLAPPGAFTLKCEKVLSSDDVGGKSFSTKVANRLVSSDRVSVSHG